MTQTKPCAQCGKEFTKSPSVSMAAWPAVMCCSRACANARKIGQPSKKRGKKYESRAGKIPCRICGQPTRYSGVRRTPLWDMVRCDAAACREESKRLKNERIREKHKADYATGARSKLRHLWVGVKRVSLEEVDLAPWMLARGFVQQYKFLTGIKGVGVPRCWWFDFAMPDRKVCVEIDGTVHRLRVAKDAHRDAVLKEKGWRVFRIPASLVRSSYAEVLLTIEKYLAKSGANDA